MKAAAAAALEKDKTKLFARPVRQYSQSRNGDSSWPPLSLPPQLSQQERLDHARGGARLGAGALGGLDAELPADAATAGSTREVEAARASALSARACAAHAAVAGQDAVRARII